jgi:hypothetical protein
MTVSLPKQETVQSHVGTVMKHNKNAQRWYELSHDVHRKLHEDFNTHWGACACTHACVRVHTHSLSLSRLMNKKSGLKPEV